MGRTIVYNFYHPKCLKQSGERIDLPKWKDKNKPYYYGNIPSYLNQFYKALKINLKNECTAIIPEEQILPHVIIDEQYKDEFLKFLTESSSYDEKFKKVKQLTELFMDRKYCMFYLHYPKKEEAEWFMEARFYDLKDRQENEKIKKEISEKIEEQGFELHSFLEEWLGFVFNKAAEFLLFKKKMNPIFYSCTKCYRPSILIKKNIQGINNTVNDNNIYGTVNVVDSIIKSAIVNYGFIDEEIRKKRALCNIIYYDESFIQRPKPIYNDCVRFENETDGAFILITEKDSLISVLKEIKRKKPNCHFDLIITGSTSERILPLILKDYNSLIKRVCIYTSDVNRYSYLKGKYPIIKGIYYYTSEVIKFMHEEDENIGKVEDIYETTKIVSYEIYNKKYFVLHSLISHYYGDNIEESYNSAKVILQDFLFWYPKLEVKIDKKNDTNNENKSKVDALMESLAKFKDINDNEEEIIRKYTEETGSFYKDFNIWLSKLDPLAYKKISWFISGLLYSLNNYSIEKGHGINKTITLYRGVEMCFVDLIRYKRFCNHLVTFPQFTSTSSSEPTAKRFAKRHETLESRKKSGTYSTVITITYNFKDGFIPYSVDIKDISKFPEEEEKLFSPFSFFIIKEVKISNEEYIAEISIESVGRKEVLEEKIKMGKRIQFNEKEGYMEAVNLEK